MPTFERASAALVRRSHRLPRTGARSRRPCTGRGLVWWQMSATAISTSRGTCSRLTPTARQVRRDADRLLQRAAARRRTPRRRRSTPADVRQLVELRRHRLAVPGQHGVDHQRVGQAVVQVADGAERVRARVHGAEVLLERDRAHHRAHHHVGARREVARLAHRRQRARARRCACPRARCRRRAGGRPATGSSRRCGSARPCRSPRSPPAAGRASARGRRRRPWRGSAARRRCA